MLTAIRSKASSWVIKILFGFLVLSFAVWGIGDIFRSPGRQAAAIEVGDTSISGTDVAEAFQRQLRQLQERTGAQLDTEQARQMGMVDNVVRQLVDDTLLQVDLERLGIIVPDDLIRLRIEAEPTFRGESGKFDRNMYAFVLRQNDLTEDRYVASLRGRLAQEQLVSALIIGAAPPKTLTEAIHSYRGETRVAKTLLIPRSTVGAIPDPAPEVLQAYYEETKDAFMAPEYRSVTLVVLSPDELAKGKEISDERLRQEYDAKKQSLGVPERRHIRQFVVSDEAAAMAAAERLKTEPFDQVATEVSGGDPIDLGTVSQADLAAILPELAEAAFAPTATGVVGPVKTALGLHLLKVEAIEPGHTPSFEDVRETLRQSTARDEAVAEIIDLANDLDDALAGGADLETAAGQLNLQAQKISAVDVAGKAPDGTDVAPIAGNQVLQAMAFGTAEGQTSTLTELGDGSYAILRIDGVRAAAPRPLEEVRADVVAAWLKEEEDKALAAKAEAAAERIRGGETVEAIATELAATAKTSAAFLRDEGDTAADVDRRLAASLFALKRGEVATAQAEGDHVVAQLVEIKAPEPLAAEAAAALEGELTQQLSGDLVNQYVRALRRDIPVSVDQPLIDSLFE